MSASIEVMFLVTVAAVSVVYAFILEVRRTVESDRLLEWLKAERSVDWEALTRSERFLTVRAVEILRRGPLAGDGEFQAHYRMTRHGRRFAIAMSIGITAIALLVVGNLLFDWNW